MCKDGVGTGMGVQGMGKTNVAVVGVDVGVDGMDAVGSLDVVGGG